MPTNIFIGSASNANWGSASNWSLGTVPSVNGDLIIFTSSSGTCSLNTNYACNSIDFTNYDKRFSLTNNLTIYGDIIYGNKMIISASAGKYISVSNPTGSSNAISNITSNGFTISHYMILDTFPSGSGQTIPSTFSFNGDFNILGTFSITGNYDSRLLGTSSFYFFNGGRLALASGTNKIGTINLFFTGTSSITDTQGSGGNISCPITITAGNSTVTLSTSFRYGGSASATFSYYSGKLPTATKFYATNPVYFFAPGSTSSNLLPFTFDGTSAGGGSDLVYLNSDVYVVGGIDKTNPSGYLAIRNYKLFIYGGTLNTVAPMAYIWNNDADIFIYGTSSTSNISINCSNNGWFVNNITINTPGTVNINTFKMYSQGGYTNTFNVIAGTFTNTNVLNLASSIILNTSRIYWNTINLPVDANSPNARMTLNEPLVGNTLNITSTYNISNYFTGSYGFSVSYFNLIPSTTSTVGAIYLKAGITYSVANSVVIGSDLRSDTTNSKAKFIVANGVAPQSISAQNIVDIDSSGGATLWYNSSNTTATRTINWNALSSPKKTLINLSATTGNKNLADMVWNVVDNTYVSPSSSNVYAITNTGLASGFNTYLTTTFSGGGSASHIAIKLAYLGNTTNTSYGITGSLFLGITSVTISSFTACVAGGTISFDVSYFTNYPNYSNSISEYNYSATNYLNSWLVFKLPRAVSLTASQYQLYLASNVGGTNLRILTTSITGVSSIMSFLVKSTTASRTPADDLILSGEYSGTNSITSYNITMNATSSTDIYNNITVAPNANLIFSTASNYNPWLSLNGDLYLGGGSLIIGSTISAIPTSSVAKIQFNGTASYPVGTSSYSGDTGAVGIYLKPGSNLIMYGSTTTYSTTLSASASIGSATLSVTNGMNWNVGDQIIIAPTEAYNQIEVFNITRISGLTISISGTLSYSHVVEGPYAPHVLNLSRNIQLYGNTAWSGFGSFIQPFGWSYIDINNVQMYALGNINNNNYTDNYTLATYTKYQFGIYLNTGNLKYNSNSISIKNSSFKDVDYITTHNVSLPSKPVSCNITLDKNIFYKLSNSVYGGNNATSNLNTMYYTFSSSQPATFSNIYITNNFYIGYTTNTSTTLWATNNGYYGGILLGATDIFFTGNTMIGIQGTSGNSLIGGIGAVLNINNNFFFSASAAQGGNSLSFVMLLGDYNNNTFYANKGALLHIFTKEYNLTGKKFSNFNFWKNNLTSITGTSQYNILIYGKNITLDSFNSYKNTSGIASIAFFQPTFNIKVINSTFSNPSISYGITTYNIERLQISFENCFFSHSTADVLLDSMATSQNIGFPVDPNIRILFNNTYLNSTVLNSFNMNSSSYIKANKINGITGSYISWYRGGVVSSDNSATMSLIAPSVKATPNTILALTGLTALSNVTATNSGIYLIASKKTIPVYAGTILNISVNVRKSASIDGASYNGLQPRLVIGLNTLIGVYTDTVLKTGISSNGIYETVSATFSTVSDGVADIWIDCNGNTGWINVDEWNISYT